VTGEHIADHLAWHLTSAVGGEGDDWCVYYERGGEDSKNEGSTCFIPPKMRVRPVFRPATAPIRDDFRQALRLSTEIYRGSAVLSIVYLQK